MSDEKNNLQSSNDPGNRAGSPEANSHNGNGYVDPADLPADIGKTAKRAERRVDWHGRKEGADNYNPFDKPPSVVVGGLYAAEHGKAQGRLSGDGYRAVAALTGIDVADARAVGLIDRDHKPSVAEVEAWYADHGHGVWNPNTKASVTRPGLAAAIKGLDPRRKIALVTIHALAAEGVNWAVSAGAKAAADNLDASVRDKTYSFAGAELIDSYGATTDELVGLPPITAETRLESLRLLKKWAATENLHAQDTARTHLAAASASVIELPPVTSLADLLAEDDDPVRMRIEQVWPMGGAKGSCAAPAGAGKTNFNINLIRSLADGDPFLGAFDVHPTDVRIAVIDLEMNKPMTRRWLRRQGVRNVGAVVDVLNLRGNPGLFDMGNDRLRDMWARRLRDQGVNFVTFDCLKPVLDIMGLNENTEMGKFLTPFDVMLTEAEVDDVLVYHHTGHASGAAGERARGDSTLLGWTDVNLKIIRDDDGDRFFAADKVRDAEEPAPEGQLTFDPTTGHLTYTGENRAATAVTENIEKRMHAVLDALADAATEGTDEMNATAIRSAVGGKNDITDKALTLAKERGLVTLRFKGRARLYRILPKAASDAMYAGGDSGLDAVPDTDIAEVVELRPPHESGRKSK